MTLSLHNLLMRLGSPLAHAILLGIAIAFMSVATQAHTLAIADDPACGHCIRFKDEVMAPGILEPRVTVLSFTHSVGFSMRPDLWPDWFKTKVTEGKITGGPIWGTPTFLIFDDEGVEVGRFSGYSNSSDFHERLKVILDAIEAQ